MSGLPTADPPAPFSGGLPGNADKALKRPSAGNRKQLRRALYTVEWSKGRRSQRTDRIGGLLQCDRLERHCAVFVQRAKPLL